MDPFKKNPQFLEAFRAGAPQALTKVYRAFVGPLRRFVVRGFAFKSGGRDLHFQGLWAEHDLDDIVQETFRRAFGVRARAAYDGERPYKNYLFTIARNAVITDLTHRRRLVPVGDALLRDGHAPAMSPVEGWVVAQRTALSVERGAQAEAQLEGLEVYALVRSFIHGLGADEVRLFEVRFLGQHSQEQSARRLGWNRARVRKLEARLRRAFLSYIVGTGYLERAQSPEARFESPRTGRRPRLDRSPTTDPAGASPDLQELLRELAA